MCVWNVSEEDRRCEYCSYRQGCERYPVRELPEGMAGWYVQVMSDILKCNILMRSRKRELVWGRYMVAYRLVKNGLSLGKIGKLLGMDHATVLHGRRQIEEMLSMPKMYPDEMEIWYKFDVAITLNQ